LDGKNSKKRRRKDGQMFWQKKFFMNRTLNVKYLKIFILGFYLSLIKNKNIILKIQMEKQ